MPEYSRVAIPDAGTASFADPAATTAGSPAATTGLPAPAPAVAGRYALGAEIARGGMGAVFRAIDAAFAREVAVKVLLDKYAPSSAAARRFHDEARITGQLQHPGIPPAFDLGVLPDGRPFLAMKLIKGETLHDQLSARADIAADRGRLVAVFEQVCQAVACAHAQGVVHRDLKPQNVMVGAFGEVQVMDWGLAKVLTDSRGANPGADPEVTSSQSEIKPLRDSEHVLTQAGSVLGTPAYMPPEQARGAVDEIDARSDVFGLGSILAAVLTGRPPFVGDTANATRVMAAWGELAGCFERLDRCGADPGLVELCKRCLAPSREDRPADAGEVARAVAELRAAADDRARQAELEKVKAEGEFVAAAAKSAERRKRRRVWLGAAAALVVAMGGGLAVVLFNQRQANADLGAKNADLEAERAKVEQRFEMARKAIAAFHSTVDEQPELGNEAFRPLRARLLRSAAEFYRELEGMLAGETDPKSRKALADGYDQLAELTDKVGDQTEALALYRRCLEVRRELAAAPQVDTDARLAVSVAVRRVGGMLFDMGDTAKALEAYDEARELAAALEAEAPTDAVRQALAASHNNRGILLHETGRPADALAAFAKARDIRQMLADANPTATQYQREHGFTLHAIGFVLGQEANYVDALAAYKTAQDIREKLAAAHPTVTGYQSDLARSYNNLGALLLEMGKPVDALTAFAKAREIRQRLVDAHPAVTDYQSDLAQSHNNVGALLFQTGKPTDALVAYQQARDIRQLLADAHPTVPYHHNSLASSHYNLGELLSETGKPAAALLAYQQARDIGQTLAEAHPTVPDYQRDLAECYNGIGILMTKTGRPADAVIAHQQARNIRQKLVAAHPTVPDYQNNLAQSHNNLGRVHAQEGRFAEAFAAFDAGLEIRQKLVGANSSKATRYGTGLGISHAYRGWARVRAGQPKEAAEDLRRALDIWAEHPALPIAVRFESARALALLAGLGREANSGVTADEVNSFADRAEAALADAVKAGSSQPDELKERDFDAIRDRSDFKKLQAEVEAKAPKLPEVDPKPRGAKR